MTLQSPKSLNSVRKKVREKKGIKNVRLGMPKYKFRQPCVECGELSRNGSRCEKHQRKIDGERDAVRNARKKLTGQYSGDYQKRAREVRRLRNGVGCVVRARGGTILGRPTTLSLVILIRRCFQRTVAATLPEATGFDDSVKVS